MNFCFSVSDIVFCIYLYQKYNYRVDPKRMNEYGTSGEMFEQNGETAAIEGETAAIEDTPAEEPKEPPPKTVPHKAKGKMAKKKD